MAPDTTTVVARTADRFGADAFAGRHDEFKNVVVLSRDVLDDLYPNGHSNTGYISAKLAGGVDPVQLYAISFDPSHEPTTYQGTPEAYVRLNLQERIGCDVSGDPPLLELTAVNAAETGELALKRRSTHQESTEVATCYANPDVLESLGVDDGDSVEAFNPERGGRMVVTARAAPELDPGDASLGTRARQLLRVRIPRNADGGSVTSIRLREHVREKSGSRSIRERVSHWIMRRAVGYHEVNLRVFIGLNADENRRVVRMNEETMRLLGVNEGDKIEVVSGSQTTSVRCLPVASDSYLIEQDADIDGADVHDRNLLLPATERDAVGAVADDVVTVRRDTSYVAGNSIVPSMFGLLGVFIGGPRVLSILLPEFGRVQMVVTLTLLSALAVWMVLWPERQRCR
jgi:formylmethanofuran dehydrogenase subunit D